MNQYLILQNEFRDKITNLIKSILSLYNSVLELKIEDVNLLKRPDNCIESSTAIGFLLEEFISTKLIEITSKNKNNENEIYIERKNYNGTQNSSFDFFCNYKNHLFLINIKSDRGANNAIAALNQLHSDYVESNNHISKHFLVLKLMYSINDAMIVINGVNSFFLEEVDFSRGYKSDSRNWSENFKNNSGRLQVSKTFLEKNKTPNELISDERTKDQIDKIYKNIIKKIKDY